MIIIITFIIIIISPKMLAVRAKLWRLFSGGHPLEQALNTEIIIITITITITIHHTIALDSAVWYFFGQQKTGRPCDSTCVMQCVMYRAPVRTYRWFDQADLIINNLSRLISCSEKELLHHQVFILVSISLLFILMCVHDNAYLYSWR